LATPSGITESHLAKPDLVGIGLSSNFLTNRLVLATLFPGPKNQKQKQSINPNNHPNVGKYTIPGASGNGDPNSGSWCWKVTSEVAPWSLSKRRASEEPRRLIAWCNSHLAMEKAHEDSRDSP
jgi:hypothetical protein